MWLNKSSENIDDIETALIIEKAIHENSLESLPNDVKNKFVINDCIVGIPYDETSIQNLSDNLIKTIHDIENKTAEYEFSDCNDDKGTELFWNDVTDKNNFFMANLSEYSSNLHKPYNKYLSEKGYLNGNI